MSFGAQVTATCHSTYLPNSLSMPTTHASNATAHPSLVDVDPTQKKTRGNGNTKKAAAAEKRQEKQEKREAAVRKIASIEQHMAAEDTFDITPGPRTAIAKAPRGHQHSQGRASHSYLSLIIMPLTVKLKHVSASQSQARRRAGHKTRMLRKILLTTKHRQRRR